MIIFADRDNLVPHHSCLLWTDFRSCLHQAVISNTTSRSTNIKRKRLNTEYTTNTAKVWIQWNLVLKDHRMSHTNVVSEDRWPLMIGSITLKYRTFRHEEYLVSQDRWSFMAVVSQDRFHCIVTPGLTDHCHKRPLRPHIPGIRTNISVQLNLSPKNIHLESHHF